MLDEIGREKEQKLMKVKSTPSLFKKIFGWFFIFLCGFMNFFKAGIATGTDGFNCNFFEFVNYSNFIFEIILVLEQKKTME